MRHDMPVTPARELREVVEAVAGSVYFLPEAIERYKGLGLGYWQGYHASRGGCLGRVPGEVVAAAFGVFYPPLVVDAVAKAWAVTTPEEVLAARLDGVREGLRRILAGASGPPDGAGLARATELLKRAGEAGRVEGRPLFAGLRSLPWPGDPVGDFFRAADIVREHRGDCHVAAWVSHQLHPIEAMTISEAHKGYPLGTVVSTRRWPEEEVEVRVAGLRERGLLDGERLTPAGEELRESVEALTDRNEAVVVEALGDDVEELVSLLTPLAYAVVEAGAYPSTGVKLPPPA